MTLCESDIALSSNKTIIYTVHVLHNSITRTENNNKTVQWTYILCFFFSIYISVCNRHDRTCGTRRMSLIFFVIVDGGVGGRDTGSCGRRRLPATRKVRDRSGGRTFAVVEQRLHFFRILFAVLLVIGWKTQQNEM